MPYDPAIHQRRSIRLQGYDYSQAGAYFLTLCTHERQCLFGTIQTEIVQLNTYGKIVQQEWLKTPLIRKEIELDEFVIMPNHFHAIVLITSEGKPPVDMGVRQTPLRLHARSIGSMVGGFKAAVTKRINQFRHTPRQTVWQRNYHEHVIRNDADLARLREYTANNPLKWTLDRYYSDML